MKRFLIKNIIIFILVILLVFIYSSSIFAVKIVLDPGHGGSDPGASSHSGINEKDINLKVARYLKEYLSQYNGIEVLMTRNGEISGKLEIVERGMIARNNNADMVFSLHFNSSTNTSVTGAEVYVTRCTTFDKYNKENTILGNLILQKLNTSLGIKNNGVKTRLCNDKTEKFQYSDGGQADYYGIIRYPMKGDASDWGIPIDSGEGIPTILIEHCYMSSSDTQYFDSDEDLRKIAKADADAIVEYFGLTVDDPTKVKLISLDKQQNDIAINDTVQLEFSVLPSTAINKKVTYTNSNPEVATIDENGKITGIKEGTTTITITSEDGKKAATFIANIKDIELISDKTQINLLTENTSQIIPNITPASLTNKSVTYESSKPEIATVDENGVVTGISEGQSVITITTQKGNKTAQVNVNVIDRSKYLIQIKDRNIVNDVISKVNEKTTVNSIIKDITAGENVEIVIQNSKGENITGDSLIGTGSKIIFKDVVTSQTVTEYYFVVTGDVNKDGKISPADYVLIKNHIMGGSQLSGLMLKAGDVKKDDKISAGDYVLIKNHIMGTNEITPN